MHHVVLTVGAVLVFSGSAHAGQPVPQPKAPLTTRGYKVPIGVTSVAKTYLPGAPKKAITVPVKSMLPKTTVPVHGSLPKTTPKSVTISTSPRVTRVTVTQIKVRSLSQPHGSSISLLKAALLSGTAPGAQAIRRPPQVERRVQVRLRSPTRGVQRETSPQPSLLRTLQYQFDLVQMSEALGQ